MFQLDRQDISWRHIVDVYEEDLGVKTKSKDVAITTKIPGLRRLHKITEEHIKLTSRSRMTVKLAVQVHFIFQIKIFAWICSDCNLI